MATPTRYTAETADAILASLCEGKSLREVCRAEGMPAEGTVRLWVVEDREGFAARYGRAREVGYHMMADELLEVADDGRNDWQERSDDGGGTAYVLNGEHVQRSRLRVDTRKWLLSKALPKIYGDKVALTGADGGPVKYERIERTIVDPQHTDG